MAKRDKDRSHHGRILEAARTLVARNGYDGTTVRSICRLAGISTGGFSAHFKTKHEAVSALLDEIVGELVERLVFASEQTLAGEDRIENHLRAMTGWAFSQPESLRVWFNLASQPELMETLDLRGRFLAGIEQRAPGIYSMGPVDGNRERWMALYYSYAQAFGAALMWAGAEHYHRSIGLGEDETLRMRQIIVDSTIALLRAARDGHESSDQQ